MPTIRRTNPTPDYSEPQFRQRMGPFVWGPEEVDLLKRMWAEGATAAEIAKALHPKASRNAVIGKANRLGLPRRPNPVERK